MGKNYEELFKTLVESDLFKHQIELQKEQLDRFMRRLENAPTPEWAKWKQYEKTNVDN